MLKRTVVAVLAACGVWSVQAAANGEIRHENATDELGRWTELHDVGSVVGEANLKGWTVYVNGEAKRNLEVRVRDGKLCVHKLVGFYLIVR